MDQKQLPETAKPGKARAEGQLSQELITVEAAGPAEPKGADKLGTPKAW